LGNTCSRKRLIRSAKFARLVDLDRKLARYPRSADLEAVDVRATPRLALPERGDVPMCLALGGATSGALYQRKQGIDN
jgi:hypothetical protein